MFKSGRSGGVQFFPFFRTWEFQIGHWEKASWLYRNISDAGEVDGEG